MPLVHSNRKKLNEYWREHVLAWKESGLKQLEYCERERLNLGTFKSHAGKYHREQKKSVALVQIPLISETPPISTSTNLKIHIRQCTLEFDAGVDLHLLGHVLEIMERDHVAI